MKNKTHFLLIFILLVACIEEDFAQDALNASMLEEVNNLRRSGCKCGHEVMPPVPDLTWNKHLEQAAGRHAKDMDKSKLLDHIGSDGSLPDDRITDSGYIWSICGENIGSGYSSVMEAVNAWKNSPAHCHNMMDPEFNEIGAAREGTYWVQDFGTPKKEK